MGLDELWPWSFSKSCNMLVLPTVKSTKGRWRRPRAGLTHSCLIDERPFRARSTSSSRIAAYRMGPQLKMPAGTLRPSASSSPMGPSGSIPSDRSSPMSCRVCCTNA
jgi:hypothetical protein